MSDSNTAPTERGQVRQVPRLECWLVTAQTLPETDEHRRAAAPAYTAFLERRFEQIALGAQVSDRRGGEVTRRLYFVFAEDAAAARRLLEESPYQQAGVYRGDGRRSGDGDAGIVDGWGGVEPAIARQRGRARRVLNLCKQGDAFGSSRASRSMAANSTPERS